MSHPNLGLSATFPLSNTAMLDVGVRVGFEALGGAWPIGNATLANARVAKHETIDRPALRGAGKFTNRSTRCFKAWRDSKIPTSPRVASGRASASLATSSNVGA